RQDRIVGGMSGGNEPATGQERAARLAEGPDELAPTLRWDHGGSRVSWRGYVMSRAMRGLLRRWLDHGRDAGDGLPAVPLLIAQPDLLARGQPLELAAVRGPHLETSFLHDDPVLRPVHHLDLADDLGRRRYEAGPSRPDRRRVGP